MTRFQGSELVIASHNPGKVREIADLMRPFGLTCRSAAELDLAEPAETGDTFAANAELKARAAALGAGLPALADDSGLAVDLLDGAPGIYSARLAGPDRDFSRAMERLKEMLEEKGACLTAHARPKSPAAKFVCALALARPDAEAEIFLGEVAGALVWPPRGVRGFGYDPMFQPAGETETFGEMEPAKKHKMSHRAAAFRKLTAALFGAADASSRHES